MMYGLLYDTVDQIRDNKIIYIFAVIMVIMVLIIMASGSFRAQAEGTFQGEDISGGINQMLLNPYLSAMNGYLSFLVFLAVLASASVIPNMLMRGRAEYYLSRPISRYSLLINKLISVWVTYSVIITICTAVAIGTTIAVHGMFDWGLLILLAFSLLSFLIWLIVSVGTAIFTGSTVASLMVVFVLWFGQFILSGYETIAEYFGSTAIKFVLATLYYILPKSSQLSDLGFSLAINTPVTDYLPLYSSVMFAGLFLMISAYVFGRKNY